MEDDFYEGGPAASPTLLSSSAKAWHSILNTTASASTLSSRPGTILTILLGLVSIVIATRLLTGRASRVTDIQGRKTKMPYTVPMLPYWIPVLGHASFFFSDPLAFLTRAREENSRGIFALKFGASIFNVVTNTNLVQSVFSSSTEATLVTQPVTWLILQRFFGVPKSSEEKYAMVWDVLISKDYHLTQDNSHSGVVLQKAIQDLEVKIPQMITFMHTDVDLQPWERFARPKFCSNTEIEVDLFPLIADLLGNAAIHAVFGPALLEKYPSIIHDIRDVDVGMRFFLMGMPALTPWSGVMGAHQARHRVLLALDDLQRALDDNADGKPVHYSWGGLDDSGTFITERHAFFKDNGFEVKERSEIVLLWALAAKTNHIAFWQLLYIVATPRLLSRIRTEIAHSTTVMKPFSIGSISEAPKLSISRQTLSTECPLLKATYLETLRLCAQPFFTQRLATDLELADDESSSSFIIRKGEYVTIPYALHMRDAKNFKDPTEFNPERFIAYGDDGNVSVSSEILNMRLYGHGNSNDDALGEICQDGFLQENLCLSLVAGVLAMWDITPADKEAGWIIPEMDTNTFVARPKQGGRIRIKKRRFDWDR